MKISKQAFFNTKVAREIGRPFLLLLTYSIKHVIMREKIADIIRNNQNGDTDWDEMLDQLRVLYYTLALILKFV